ncbi:hypothetical protein LCGC14_1736610 [marine sediment metagenome]|uniref:Uncharacterized protein n=1 Tax=marine sediment metagenome TaxID=412755 RepID=A0A0F9K7K2_9ZZZZ
MDAIIRFRTSEEDKKALEAEARKLGLTVSAFIRLLIRQWDDGIRFERR